MKIFGISSASFTAQTQERTDYGNGTASIAVYEDEKLTERRHENTQGQVDFKTLYNTRGFATSTIEYAYKPDSLVIARQYKSSVLPMNISVTKPNGEKIVYEYDGVLAQKNIKDRTRHPNYNGIQTITYYNEDDKMTRQKEYRDDKRKIELQGIELENLKGRPITQKTTGSLYKTVDYHPDGSVHTQKFDYDGNPTSEHVDYVI